MRGGSLVLHQCFAALLVSKLTRIARELAGSLSGWQLTWSLSRATTTLFQCISWKVDSYICAGAKEDNPKSFAKYHLECFDDAFPDSSEA